MREPKQRSLKKDKKRGYDPEKCQYKGKDLSHKIFDTPLRNQELIYVKLEDHTFKFALRPKERVPNKPGQRRIDTLPHSMLARGKRIIGAGECETDENGKIIEINNHSGHYQPDEDNLRETKENMMSQELTRSAVKWKVFDKTGKLIKEI
ncbi:MAG TPA: hypothetical protein ENK58_02055 [Desulfobacterales bacterium]|nr:MAG: hypothetical protein DRI57_01395 [Deltaproteobacteria bacterium]HHC24188.1 hypothetical protein [Desulfobacterales bacterium]